MARRNLLGGITFTVGLLDNTELYAYVLFGCFLVTVGGGSAFIALRKRKSAREATS